MSINVLVVAAHPDDEVLGCGGTIARHVAEGDAVNILFVADGETSRDAGGIVPITLRLGESFKEAVDRELCAKREQSALQACTILGCEAPTFLIMPDQRLDQIAFLDIVRRIEAHPFKPDIIYTHHAGDLNMDHRIVHQAVMTAFRPLPDAKYTAIYAFEVPSSTEWGSGFEPDHFVDISAFRDIKDSAVQAYGREITADARHARSYEAIIARDSLRGSQCGVPRAEAFMTMRTIRR